MQHFLKCYGGLVRFRHQKQMVTVEENKMVGTKITYFCPDTTHTAVCEGLPATQTDGWELAESPLCLIQV